MSSPKPSDRRIILVTGANKGIGYEAVKLLSVQLPNATIILGSRSVDNGHAAVKKMQEETTGHAFTNVHVVALDITDNASIAQAVQRVQAEHGRLDALLHNSGISNVNGDMKSKLIFDVNLQGARDCVDAFLPLIPAGGIIDVVSSEVGALAMNCFTPSLRERLNDPSQVTYQMVEELSADWLKAAYGQPATEDWSKVPNAYPVSKALVSAWTRAFALQHPDIKTVATSPGFCSTQLNHFRGTRPASLGGESVVWPLLHPFDSGRLYFDGKEIPWIAPDGAVLGKPPI